MGKLLKGAGILLLGLPLLFVAYMATTGDVGNRKGRVAGKRRRKAIRGRMG